MNREEIKNVIIEAERIKRRGAGISEYERAFNKLLKVAKEYEHSLFYHADLPPSAFPSEGHGTPTGSASASRPGGALSGVRV